MTTTGKTPWIAYREPRDTPRLRLFCLPFAGGGASIYRPWRSQVPDDIEVCPIQLPGRENRIKEPLFTAITPLVEDLIMALSPFLDRPFAFFGHSMGAMIAYETVWRLREVHGLSAAHLLVSGRRAPHIPPKQDAGAHLGDDEFLEKIESLAGTPPQVLRNRELMKLLLPVMRADFEVNNHYVPADRQPVDCPVTVYGGRQDGEASEGNLSAWADVTTSPHRVKLFSGGHFYVNEQGDALLSDIIETLSG